MGMSIKEMPEDARPFEKCMVYGPEALDNAELLALVLRTGSTRENSVETARRVIELAGGTVGGLALLSMKELKLIPGIGDVKASEIRAVSVLAGRIAKSERMTRPDFASADWIAGCYMEEMRQERTEVLKALYLDGRMKLIRESLLSKGSANRSMVPVREIFVEALKCDAVFLILIHNHPSGDPTPSKEDFQVTERVKNAGELVGITLVDHIVFGDGRYVSLRERGVIG